VFLTDELIARLADLQIWVVAQPSFLYDSGGTSPSPGIRLRPFATAARAGVRQAFSSDFPCGSNAPLLGISAAVTRRSRRGDVFDGEEALSAAAALHAYTIDAARAAGTDGECGSLEPGKRADFLVLSGNPVECRTEDIASIRVLETWAGGARIFNRP
jgi:predicted amidohydrolase YtcJ